MKTSGQHIPIQLNLFDPVIFKKVHLIAESPKNAFYRLWLEAHADGYILKKESGSGERVLDRRQWTFKSREIAEKKFDRRVRDKINPDRKSPRKYKIKEPAKG
jgi:hypothetical protein